MQKGTTYNRWFCKLLVALVKWWQVLLICCQKMCTVVILLFLWGLFLFFGHLPVYHHFTTYTRIFGVC